MDNRKYYKISEISDILKITTRTIRYYEQEGLLSSVTRTPGGMRLFTEKDVELIKQIRGLQKDEFLSLTQIKEQLTNESVENIDQEENIVIVTDSTASLPKMIIDDLNIRIIPLNIILDGKTYKDGVDINAIDFFNKVNGSNYKATTAPPSQESLVQLYQSLAKSGYTKILSIHIANHWSETFATAQSAAKQVSNVHIEVVDSFNTGLGMGLLAYVAAKMAKEKKKFSYIIAEIKEKRKRCWQIMYINSLDYFIQGVDKTTIQGELLNTLLDYKPILFYNPEYGKFTVTDRTNNPEEAVTKLLKSIKDYEKEYGRIFRYVGITHSYFYQEAYELMKRIKATFPYVNVIIAEASPIINTYVGFYSMSMSIC
ncbi:MAG: hypothetical protein A2X42_08225 [Candidatus Margulisbacteria bacterium GWF2_38_17]|nr:MAG: hypothetical protein A2X43_04725 [Candidatus Margulisbacteria bacterium GWD2_39_127]OGI01553.1 MAG: hypothetical protein A2X42_08225 [Candidatus Margulisbacteria bacterium GWF2_38_17]OGI09994.1 MAG: hypothetical protein A2X41_08935 [Candidatus Margulisbacteria bacterium GWE2_39_32]